MVAGCVIAGLSVFTLGGCPAAGVDQSQVDQLTQDLNDLAQQVQAGLSAPGVPGADGDKGDTGATGPAGPVGADGLNGASGAAGPAGLAGANGLNGASGAQGAQGSAGKDGKDGADGTNGANGTDGTNGTNGSDGADGQDGQDGQNGQDLTGVLARAQIRSDGTNATAPNAIASQAESTGKYLVTVTMPDDFDTTGLDKFSFPVVVTPQVVPPWPGGPVDTLYAAVEQIDFVDSNADGRKETLDLRIHMKRVNPVSGALEDWNAGFSIVVLAK
jgi:hypothetical protein